MSRLPWKPIRTKEDLEDLLSNPAEVERRVREGTLAFRTVEQYTQAPRICGSCGLTEAEHTGETKECPDGGVKLIVAWLRSGDGSDPVGGDDYVALAIANAIERGEHVRWRDSKR